MNRFIDKNGEVFIMINESTFDKYVFKTIQYFKGVDSAGGEDYMRKLCGYIFARYPNERPEKVQKKISESIRKINQKCSWEEINRETLL